MPGQAEKFVAAALEAFAAFKLVDLAAGLETEMPDGFTGDILCQRADVEFSCPPDHFLGYPNSLEFSGQI